MNQDIRFCTASDNIRLAYARVGRGLPLVKVGNWMSHLEHDWNSPVWRPWLENWSRFHTFYRYDPRGCGLSDWNVSDFSFYSLVSDLETIVDVAGLEQFDLFAMSQGGSIAIAYTAQHPERVRRLIVYGGYVRGTLMRNPTPEQIESAEPAWGYFWEEFYRFLGIDFEALSTKAEVSAEDKVWAGLSTREREVLRLLAQGYNNQEISQKLVLSEKTVRNHVSNIYEKLQINSRGEAILLARKLGLTEEK
jgi:pimeloyl-ACP methyl ester carboxylesterase